MGEAIGPLVSPVLLALACLLAVIFVVVLVFVGVFGGLGAAWITVTLGDRINQAKRRPGAVGPDDEW